MQPTRTAPEVVACIGEDRHATAEEFSRLFERMTLEVGGAAAAWAPTRRGGPSTPIQRAACAALHGSDAVTADRAGRSGGRVAARPAPKRRGA